MSYGATPWLPDAVASSDAPYQTRLAAIWIERGLLACALTTPNAALVTPLTGRPKLGLLNVLNAQKRNHAVNIPCTRRAIGGPYRRG
jgi:hypothetical protein